jgi:hypothetical protein
MYSQSRLKLMSVFFAVFWTAGMVWWTGEYHVVHLVMLAIAGTVAAILWYWAMSRYLRWQSR